MKIGRAADRAHRPFQESRVGATLALVDMSWILESNMGMQNMIASLGGEPHKRYRIFQKNIG